LFSHSWFLMHARICSNLSCFLGKSGSISTRPTTSSFNISPRSQQAPFPSVPGMTSHSFSLPGTKQFWPCTSAAPNPWLHRSRKHVRPVPRQQINSRKRIIYWNTTSWKRLNPSSRQNGIAANPALPAVTRSGFISEWMGFVNWSLPHSPKSSVVLKTASACDLCGKFFFIEFTLRECHLYSSTWRKEGKKNWKKLRGNKQHSYTHVILCN
jgi:hypothetical protein